MDGQLERTTLPFILRELLGCFEGENWDMVRIWILVRDPVTYDALALLFFCL